MEGQIALDETGNLSRLEAGTDEVGRGPLAGDVVAAAVILDSSKRVNGLVDSKQLSGRRRAYFYSQIIENARSWAVARASVVEVDQLNIFQASLLAMSRAVDALDKKPDFVYVDGKHCPKWNYPSKAIVKGDSLIPSIAAASIIAKVTRDHEMEELDKVFPGYGFAQHKGYPTSMHLKALQILGPCSIHRRSFGPVAKLVNITN